MTVETRPERVEPSTGISLPGLVEEYFMEVYGVCFRLLGRPHDAEDATQETFLSLFRIREKLAQAQSVRAFVLAVARNTAISIVRTRRAASLVPEALAEARPIPGPGDPERLARALAGLSEEELHLVQMRFMEGKGPEEMARASGRNRGSIATALCRALQRLRELYHGGAR